MNNYSKENEKFDIKNFLKISVSQGASDIHIRQNVPPMIRKDGSIFKSKFPSLTTEDIETIIKNIVPNELQKDLKTKKDIDFSLEIKEVSRFRVNLFHENGNIGIVLRTIPFDVPGIEELLLPPVIKKFTKYNNGLVLVTGPTGSGKSTTLASLLDYINQNQAKHIITLEDPIEFIHTNKKSIFTQRQLELDVKNFPSGIKYALRQDPDIILIGEMRDRETITSALKAAETGHLVFSTLHTTDAVQTINRIINSFEPHEREPIRLQIANTLRGTIAQKLVKKVNNQGRAATTEILTVTPATQDYIARNEIENIYQLIKQSKTEGLLSLNLSLYRLVNAKLISAESAIHTSNTPNEMEQMLRGAFQGSSNFD